MIDVSQQKPIFLTGLYRSGTTLVSRMLNNHPQLAITFDSVHFMRFSHGKYDPVETRYKEIVAEIKERIARRWSMILDDQRVLEILSGCKNAGYAEVYDAIMTVLMCREQKDIRWGEKTNVCWGKIPAFLKMFPKGKAINIIRDPRDAMISYKKITDEPGFSYLDTAFAALHSFQTTARYQQELPAGRFYCLRYETLLEEPEQESRRVCDFLEIPYNSIILDGEKFVDKVGQHWDGDSSHGEKFTGPSKKAMGRWNKFARPVEIYFLEMVLKKEMPAFGYALSGVTLNKEDERELSVILEDDFIKERHAHWQKTGTGVEAFPSDPVARGQKAVKAASSK